MYSGTDYQENVARLAKLTKPQRDEMYRIERGAIARFKGQLDELEAALGMLRMGHHFGWRVLVLIHDKRTIRKYEQILAIKVINSGSFQNHCLLYMADHGFLHCFGVII